MELYAGLDLHSRNTYIGIMDKTFNRVFKKRVPNHLEQILQTLDPFRDQIKGFVVESTFNWYWLVDGLFMICPCHEPPMVGLLGALYFVTTHWT